MAREKKHSNANEKCQKMRNSKCWQNTILGLILQTSTAFHLLSSFHISFWFQIHLQFFLSHCVTADGSKTKTVETKPSSLLLQAELVSCLHPAAPALHEQTWTDCIKNLNQRIWTPHPCHIVHTLSPYPLSWHEVLIPFDDFHFRLL